LLVVRSMYYIPKHQPACQIFGNQPAKSDIISDTNDKDVEKRLHMLGIRNSVINTLPTIYENGILLWWTGYFLQIIHLTRRLLPKITHSILNSQRLIKRIIVLFTLNHKLSQFNDIFKLRDLSKPSKEFQPLPNAGNSIWVWLWREWLAYHGNCAVCDRPLNGSTELTVMNACAHAMHMECAEEIQINVRQCPKCFATINKEPRNRCTHLRCCCRA
uniref:RING-type domain-containing protein n=1 Tax=Anisakis simplex TaxID=6269 RepID=A0A0M3J0B5_ANISI